MCKRKQRLWAPANRRKGQSGTASCSPLWRPPGVMAEMELATTRAADMVHPPHGEGWQLTTWGLQIPAQGRLQTPWISREYLGKGTRYEASWNTFPSPLLHTLNSLLQPNFIHPLTLIVRELFLLYYNCYPLPSTFQIWRVCRAQKRQVSWPAWESISKVD